MPLAEDDSEARSLIRSPSFHLSFIQKYGYHTWIDFVAGVATNVGSHPEGMEIFDPDIQEDPRAKGTFLVKQSVVEWEVPFVDLAISSNIAKLGSEVILASGDSHADFVDMFPRIFKKLDLRSLKRDLEDYSEAARDAGYQMFPGVKEYIKEAAEYLSDYLLSSLPRELKAVQPKGTKEKAIKSLRLNLYLATGYTGEDDLEEFVGYLLEGDEKSNEQDELCREIEDALNGGLADAYSAAVEVDYRDELRSSIEKIEFDNASLEFDGDKWKLTVSLKSLLEYLTHSTKSDSDRVNDHFYTNVQADDLEQHFFEYGSYYEAPDYPSPDHIDWSYGYDYFSDQMPKRAVKGIL